MFFVLPILAITFLMVHKPGPYEKFIYQWKTSNLNEVIIQYNIHLKNIENSNKEEIKKKLENEPYPVLAQEMYEHFLDAPNRGKYRICALDIALDFWIQAEGLSPKETYYRTMREVETHINDPEQQMYAYKHYIRQYCKDNWEAQARAVYKKMLELNPNHYYLEEAKNYLFAMDSLGVGDQAPEFEAKDINGNLISLTTLKGRFVLLDFWATWCTPCVHEIAILKRIYEKHNGENFTILGISRDENVSKLRNFLEEQGIEWPQIICESKFNNDVADLYKITGIPKYYVIVLIPAQI